MLRVLMVLEDYGELMFLQTVLKKLGFDVDAIQNPRSFADHVLSMNPDVLVMTAVGKRVNGVDLSRNLRRVRGSPRVILLRTPGAAEENAPVVDGWLDTPVQALTFLEMMADLCGLNKQVLTEKFQKLQMKEIEAEKDRVLKLADSSGPSLAGGDGSAGNFGNLQNSTMPVAERRERYKKFLDEKPPKEHGFAVSKVVEQVKNLRRDENPTELDDLERERKAFVEHLFKKKA